MALNEDGKRKMQPFARSKRLISKKRSMPLTAANRKGGFIMKKVLGLILAAMLLITALPTAALAEGEATEVRAEDGQTGTIVNCKTKVNVRAKATKNSKLLGTAEKGETYPVLGRSGNWVKIDFDGTDGYVYKDYIRVEGVAADVAVTGKVGTIVNCKVAANVREKATSDSKLLGTVKKGETYKVTAKAGNWIKIRYTSEKEGYVYKTFIKLADEGSETPSDTRGMIVNCKEAVNVRAKASSKSKKLGTIARGAIFEILGFEGNWVRIIYRDDEVAYVYKSFVKVLEESIEGKTGTIKCITHVNIRAKATKDSKLLGTAKNGETFKVTGKFGNWIRIDFNGKTGYVYKTYIKIK